MLQDVAKYLVFQTEKGDNGTTHYQGYIELKKPMRVVALHKLVTKDVWFRERNGTRVQARNYCMKEDTRTDGPWEYGSWNGKETAQGQRSDLEELSAMIHAGATPYEIETAMPSTYYRYSNAVQRAQYLKAQQRPKGFREVEVVIVYGKPGLGKTKAAYDLDPNLYSVPIGKDLWFDGYTGEDTILLDDFSGQMRLVDLLRVLDGHPVQVPVKGSFVYLHCTRIIITTNVHPDTWYDYTQRTDSLLALKRRVKHLLEVDDDGDFNPIDW